MIILSYISGVRMELKAKLLDQTRQALRLKHLSMRTKEA